MSTLKLQTYSAPTWGDTYTFSPTPKVEIAAERLAAPDGDLQGTRRTWTITGRVTGAQAALVVARDALESAFGFADATNKRLALRNNADDDNLDVLVDQTYKGLRLERPPAYPQGAGVQWATIRDYTIVCSAVTLVSGTAWGSVTTTTQTNAQGQIQTSVSGEYTGPGAQTAADAQKLAVDVIVMSERQTVDADKQSVAFDYQYVDTASSREVISLVETITVQYSGSDFVYQPVLGGGAPVLQTTVQRPCRVTQSGQAVGLTGYPSFPSYKYSSAYLRPESETSKESPKATKGGSLTEYGIRWNWIYEFSSAQSLLDPNEPPT